MSQIEQLECPNCGAPIEIAPGSARATCEYCGSNLTVGHGQGDFIATAAGQITAANQGQGAITELQRMNLVQQRSGLLQQLSILQMNLDNINGQVNIVQRLPKDRLTRRELSDLYLRCRQIGAEQRQLQLQVANIDQVLNPLQPPQYPYAPAYYQQPRSNLFTTPVGRGCLYGCGFYWIATIVLSGIVVALGVNNPSVNGDPGALSSAATLVAIFLGVLAFLYGYNPERGKVLIARMRNSIGVRNRQ